MARGWESKSVESQIESAQDTRRVGPQQPSKEDRELEQQKRNLLLSRAYICQRMEFSTNDRYQETLRRAMEEIDRKLADLTRGHRQG